MAFIKPLLKKVLPLKLLEEPGYLKRFDKRRLNTLKDAFLGERCFVVGNGPSLNSCDLSLLKDEYSFGVNSIFHKEGFVPKFYVVEDRHVVVDNYDSIKEFEPELHKFFPNIYRSIIGRDKKTLYYNMNLGFGMDTSPNFCIPRFSGDSSNCVYSGQSVTMTCLQLAFHMGFHDVYLIGMDFDYAIPKTAILAEGGTIISQEDDQNHFSPKCFDSGKKWFNPHLDRLKNAYRLADMTYTAHGRNISNASVGGKLEVFRRCDYRSLF